MNREKVQVTMRGVLGVLVVGGFITVATYLITTPPALDVQTATLVGAIIGYLSSKADTVVMYYFGSTESSARKSRDANKLLNEAINGTVQPTDS